jgi:hypothetical protein
MLERIHKKGNENLQNSKKEIHVLPSGENFVISYVLMPCFLDFSTKFLTHKRRYKQCSHPPNTAVSTL